MLSPLGGLEIKLLTMNYSDTSSKLQDMSSVLDDITLLPKLRQNVNDSDAKLSAVSATMRDKDRVYGATLAKNLGIGIEAAKRTRLVNTQRGIRRMIHPSLSQRFKTNDRQMRYRRLPVNMFTDTMYSKVVSRQGNKAAQIFGTSDGFARAHPMKMEIQAHEALSLLFSRYGVPNTMIMDGVKAQVQGYFRRKLCDAD